MEPTRLTRLRQQERLRNRRAAGQELAARLRPLGLRDPLVLALPRGGVPVGYEIARVLACPFDVLLVRKIGAPGSPELALGAVVDGTPPVCVINQAVCEALGPTPEYLAQEERRALAVLKEREQALRRGRGPLAVEGRTVILVDDGIATGATARAALAALRARHPARLLVAVPVAPTDTASRLGVTEDDFICLRMPEDFRAVGLHYDDFEQVEDREVAALLQSAALGHDARR